MLDQNNFVKIKRALLSVSDKTGIVDFASFLISQNIEILSTGGTAKLLTQQGLKNQEVSDYTGFPEMMDGRVKTLHPKIHGGLLGRRGLDEQVMREHGILEIDLVVVNLYPFKQAIAQPDCDLAVAIENIDIGGPTMLRSAAKNNKSVAVVVDVLDYAKIIAELKENKGQLSLKTRFDLAVKTFEHTANYDGMIANALGAYLNKQSFTGFGRTFNTQVKLKEQLRYGENPHQNAAFFVDENIATGSVANAIQYSGKALSYNNIADTDAALECVKQFDMPACVIVKHANPCGVGVAATILDAYEKAYKTDPTSAFGGIIAFNRELDALTAQAIISRQFVEVIIAPSVSEQAQAIIATKANIRLLSCGEFADLSDDISDKSANKISIEYDYKKVNSGLLIQELDKGIICEQDLKIMTTRAPSAQEIQDLLFVWKVAKFVKSNAIVFGKDLSTIGIGAGQMSRVYSTKIAAIKAADEGLSVDACVMASDAFFPFRDGIDQAAQVGIKAIIQPGGSIRDQEVIDAANEHNIAMVFTGMRHFRH